MQGIKITGIDDASNVATRHFDTIEAVHPEYTRDAILSLDAVFPGTVKIVMSDAAPPLPIYRISRFLTSKKAALRAGFRVLDKFRPLWAIGTPFCNRNNVSPWCSLLAVGSPADMLRHLSRGYLMAPDCVKGTLPAAVDTESEVVESLPAASIVLHGCTTLAEWLDTIPAGRRRSTKSRFRDLKRVTGEVVPVSHLRDSDVSLLRRTADRANIGVDYFTHEYGQELASRAPDSVLLVRVHVPRGVAGIALLTFAAGRGYLKHLGIDYDMAERYNVLSGAVRAAIEATLSARCERLYLGRIRPWLAERYAPQFEPLEAALFGPRPARIAFAYVEKRVKDTYVAKTEKHPSTPS